MTSESTTDSSQVVDAREISGEPFGAIVAALDDLDCGNTLLLINSFEPEPLYGVLSDRGYTYETTRVAEDEWHVEISLA